MGAVIDLTKNTTAPGNPSYGFGRIYVAADKNLHYVSEDGIDVVVGEVSDPLEWLVYIGPTEPTSPSSGMLWVDTSMD